MNSSQFNIIRLSLLENSNFTDNLNVKLFEISFNIKDILFKNYSIRIVNNNIYIGVVLDSNFSYESINLLTTFYSQLIMTYIGEQYPEYKENEHPVIKSIIEDKLVVEYIPISEISLDFIFHFDENQN